MEPDHLLLESAGVADLERVIAAAAGIRGIPAGVLARQTWEICQGLCKELMA